jgi:hypothetical protein
LASVAVFSQAPASCANTTLFFFTDGRLSVPKQMRLYDCMSRDNLTDYGGKFVFSLYLEQSEQFSANDGSANCATKRAKIRP